MLKDVIVITGPTGSGKSRLAHNLALSIKSEIIVADSMKVYKEADIGTSKPSKDKMDIVKYHLINIINPLARYDVGRFYNDTIKIIAGLLKKNTLPIVCGGTSLYISKLIEGLADIPGIPEKIISQLDEFENKELYTQLQSIDPARAAELHPNKRKRLIRAIGIYKTTGKKMSELLRKTEPPGYNFIVLGIYWDREKLYKRINDRVDLMMSRGLVEECRNLFLKYGENAPIMKGVGYRQLIPLLKGDTDTETAINEIKKATRNYAKSQIIWWRKKNIIWLDGEQI